MNPNAAARLPFLNPLNTPNTKTAASHSAASAKAALGDSTSEFSRMLVRSQQAATVSQRTASPAGRPPPPHRPVSPAPNPHTDKASQARSGDHAARPQDDTESVASSKRPAEARSRSAASTEARAAGANGEARLDDTAAEPVAVDATDPAVLIDTAPTPDPASIAAWSGLPLTSEPPLCAPAGDAAVTEPGEGPASSNATATAAGERPTGLAFAELAADANAGLDVAEGATDGERKPALESDDGPLPDLASTALDDLTAGAMPEAALANLAALSAGVRSDAERAARHGATDLTPPVTGLVGSPAMSNLARSIDAALPAAASASVSTPLSDPGFHEALGMQVSLLAREGIQKAELRLNPADMGPVSVQITMNGDQARVDFGADLAKTRQALEAGWAELAASLREAGFTLSGGGVSQHARDRQAPEPRADESFGARTRSADTEAASVTATHRARPRAGAALDLYA